MAPTNSRQILAWTLPTIAVLLSYLWFRRKRIEAKSDDNNVDNLNMTDKVDATSSPNRSLSRSLSGVDTQPIDIILPRKLRSHKSNPVVISDEDLDLEIEKIKSMKNGSNDPFKTSQLSNDVEKRLTLHDIRKTPERTPSFSPSPPKFTSTKVIKCTPQKSVSASPIVRKKEETFNNNNNIRKKEETLNNNNNIRKKEETLNNNNNNNMNNMENKETVKSVKKKSPKNTPKKSPENSPKQNEDIRRQSVERDSANHSPADVMLASPSMSSISDNHSEGSSDSGKGGSDVATPPSRTPASNGSLAGDIPRVTLYEFTMPIGLVGRLIGRSGAIINDIKEKSRTNIVVKKHPTDAKVKICAIEGTQANIDTALKIIRGKFPLKRFPDVTLEQLTYAPVSLTPDQLHLKLVEGINNDTIISCMVAPNHFFLQQPTHPTFPNLNILSTYMNMCYTGTDTPLLPTPIAENTICAAQSEGDWYRVMVLSTNTETNTSYVIFLDYGGYAYIENSKLRQIRGDFLLLPFQAAECILANIKPVGEEESWRQEAYSIVAELTKGALAYTQVADYTNEGVPLVLVYIFVGPQEVVFLNEELVNRGLAEWVEETEGAVGGVTS